MNPLQTAPIDLIRTSNPPVCFRSPRPTDVIPLTCRCTVHQPTHTHSGCYIPHRLMLRLFWNDIHVSTCTSYTLQTDLLMRREDRQMSVSVIRSCCVTGLLGQRRKCVECCEAQPVSSTPTFNSCCNTYRQQKVTYTGNFCFVFFTNFKLFGL